jgi:hypothetical protein
MAREFADDERRRHEDVDLVDPGRPQESDSLCIELEVAVVETEQDGDDLGVAVPKIDPPTVEDFLDNLERELGGCVEKSPVSHGLCQQAMVRAQWDSLIKPPRNRIRLAL